MQILNIDTFAQVKRQVVLKGVSHNVCETSVQQFINNLKAAEDLDGASQSAPEKLSAQVERSVSAILESIPTLEPADLKSAPIDALSALLKFIRGEMDAEAKDETGDADKASEAGEEKKAS